MRVFVGALLLALGLWAAAGAAMAAGPARSCNAVTTDIDAARAAHNMPRLAELWAEAGAPATGCAEAGLFCIGQGIALTAVGVFYEKANAGAALDDLLPVLEQGAGFGTPWQLEAVLGDLQLERGKAAHSAAIFSDAAYAYQQALLALGEPPACGDAEKAARPQVAAVEALYHHMSEALLLAEPVKIATTKCAPCQWLYLLGIEGFSPKVRPLPISFPQGSDRPTSEGRSAIAALLECLKAGKYSRIVLTGHADPVGSDVANLRLATRRLEAIRAALVKGGFDGQIVLESRGETDRFPTDGEGYSTEERNRLDRRIELTEADAEPGEGVCEG